MPRLEPAEKQLVAHQLDVATPEVTLHRRAEVLEGGQSIVSAVHVDLGGGDAAADPVLRLRAQGAAQGLDVRGRGRVVDDPLDLPPVAAVRLLHDVHLDDRHAVRRVEDRVQTLGRARSGEQHDRQQDRAHRH
jgi:hypothetical protein